MIRILGGAGFQVLEFPPTRAYARRLLNRFHGQRPFAPRWTRAACGAVTQLQKMAPRSVKRLDLGQAIRGGDHVST